MPFYLLVTKQRSRRQGVLPLLSPVVGISLERHLVSRPLRRRHKHLGLLASVWLVGQGAGEACEGLLVHAHADSEAFEVRELRGQTDGVGVHEHEVASLASDLVDLQHTLVLHSDLELANEVLAEAHWPAVLNLTDGADVLVDEAVDLGDGAVDLDLLAGEDGRDGLSAEALALGGSRRSLASGLSEGGEEVTDGVQTLGLALLHVVLNVVSSRLSVCLERQVVVSDLRVVALDGSEDVVSHVLDSHGDGGEESLLLGIDVLDGTLLHSLCLSLTDSDSALDADVEVGHHSVADLANVSAVSIGSLLPVSDDTSHVVHVVDEVLLVSADGVGQGDDTGLEELLGGAELSSDSSLSGVQLTSEGLLGVSLGDLVSGQLVVQTLGSVSQVLLEAEEVLVLLLSELGQLLAGVLVQRSHLLLCNALVLVKDGLELAASALGSGEVGVGLLLESVHLSLDVLVDLVLSSLVGHDHLGNNLDLVDHLVLDLVELVLGFQDLSHHIALSLSSLLSSSSASSIDVLHSLGETLVLDSGVFGDLVVEG